MSLSWAVDVPGMYPPLRAPVTRRNTMPRWAGRPLRPRQGRTRPQGGLIPGESDRYAYSAPRPARGLLREYTQVACGDTIFRYPYGPETDCEPRRIVRSDVMHIYELVARGVLTCYAYLVAEACDARLPFEVPVHDLPADDTRIESTIDRFVIAQGWCTYAHPGGMRYSPQWYCPRHVQAILNVPDDEEDDLARNLKNHLWPDLRR
jgi:hypothetical protein